MTKTYIHIFLSLTLLAVIGGSGYMTVHTLTKSPCDTTRTYMVGFIDPRFGIATSTVIADLKQTSNVWNAAYATTTLLSYTPSHGDIVINFTYDERQRTTIRNERLKQTISQEKVNLSELKETIESLRLEYNTLRTSIEARTASYTSHLEKHNTEVAYWNRQGGASTDTYQRLQREAESLETERISLNAEIYKFNTLAEKIREYGKNHNEIVSTINEKIDTLNQTVLRDFEEGTYDPRTHIITIYEYENENSLKRVLIHEFGHSLGLEHVSDKKAIMYSINQAKNLSLTEADKEELMKKCTQSGLKTIIAIRDDIVHLVVSSWLDTPVQPE